MNCLPAPSPSHPRPHRYYMSTRSLSGCCHGRGDSHCFLMDGGGNMKVLLGACAGESDMGIRSCDLIEPQACSYQYPPSQPYSSNSRLETRRYRPLTHSLSLYGSAHVPVNKLDRADGLLYSTTPTRSHTHSSLTSVSSLLDEL